MDGQKKDMPATGMSQAQQSANSTNNKTITQPTTQVNPAPTGDGGKKALKSASTSKKAKDKNMVNLLKKVRTLSIKCYDEQLPLGWDATCDAIRNIDKSELQVIAIRHDRDTYTEKWWEVSMEKAHYHIIVRSVGRLKTGALKTIYVGDTMTKLQVLYRQGLDDKLWENHGVEQVKNFSAYATYLTHETEQAIDDAKELYDMGELVSNLTVDEIMQIRDGYIRLVDSTKKLTTKDLAELDAIAYKLGTEFKDFSEWYGSLEFSVRSHSKMKTLKESYTRGVDAKIKEKSEILRLCIYIQGEPNTGKTYGSKKALAGKRIHAVEGGGTGKFDDLRADHDAIIISDDVCPNLLNMSDNYVCKAYKRQSGNPAWTGDYFIVTSNLSFSDWLETCKIDTTSKHYDALVSRFYVCEILKNDDGDNYLALQSASTRGSFTEQQKRLEMFLDFQAKFDEIMAGYRPQEIEIDYSKYIDKAFTHRHAQQAREEHNWQQKNDDDYKLAKQQMLIHNEQQQTAKALKLLAHKRQLGLPDDWVFDPNYVDRNY